MLIYSNFFSTVKYKNSRIQLCNESVDYKLDSKTIYACDKSRGTIYSIVSYMLIVEFLLVIRVNHVVYINIELSIPYNYTPGNTIVSHIC